MLQRQRHNKRCHPNIRAVQKVSKHVYTHHCSARATMASLVPFCFGRNLPVTVPKSNLRPKLDMLTPDKLNIENGPKPKPESTLGARMSACFLDGAPQMPSPSEHWGKTRFLIGASRGGSSLGCTQVARKTKREELKFGQATDELNNMSFCWRERRCSSACKIAHNACEGSKDPHQETCLDHVWHTCQKRKRIQNQKASSWSIMITYSSSQNGESAQLKLSHIRPKSAGLHAIKKKDQARWGRQPLVRFLVRFLLSLLTQQHAD